MIAALLLASAMSGSPIATCDFVEPSLSDESRVIEAKEAANIKTTVPVKEIFKRLGPARADPCSGIYCPEWRLRDGRRLVVGFGDPCGYPLYVSLLPPR